MRAIIKDIEPLGSLLSRTAKAGEWGLIWWRAGIMNIDGSFAVIKTDRRWLVAVSIQVMGGR